MAFRIPLPVAGVNQKSPKQGTSPQCRHLNVPQFDRKELTHVKLIGQGSFGKVFRARQNGADCVMKQLIDEHASAAEKRLFVKEAEMLIMVAGHENVVKIRAFSPNDCAILMDFVTFSFEKLGIQRESVTTLKAFLGSCDSFNDFKGFEHLQYHLATDICCGLNYLHNKDVVHRDLKPDNILVSNINYAVCDDKDLSLWWATKPITAVLTDFGESRSTLLQTRTVVNSATNRLFRGSPAYMAPEALRNDSREACMADLKKFDIWSYGMVVYNLLNPNAKYPYAQEMEQLEQHVDRCQALRDMHSAQLLPRHRKKYSLQRKGVWKPLCNVFRLCSAFKADERPSAQILFGELINAHVAINQLPVSQSSLLQSIDPEVVIASWLTNDVQQTENACTFLVLLIADRVLNHTDNDVSLAEVAVDTIINFPAAVNSRRNEMNMYGVDEAYAILHELHLCSAYEFHLSTYSTVSKSVTTAQEQLRAAIHLFMVQSEPQTPKCAVYACPPYTLLFCKPKDGQLTVVDTHMLPEKYGGSNNAATITANDPCSVSQLCQWVFFRMGVSTKAEIRQELAVMQPIHKEQNYNNFLCTYRPTVDDSAMNLHLSDSSLAPEALRQNIAFENQVLEKYQSTIPQKKNLLTPAADIERGCEVERNVSYEAGIKADVPKQRRSTTLKFDAGIKRKHQTDNTLSCEAGSKCDSPEHIRLSGAKARVNSEEKIRLSGANGRINSEERSTLSGANDRINSEERIRLSGANGRISTHERIRFNGGNSKINSEEQIRLSGANSRTNSEERIRLSGANAAINSVEQIRLSGANSRTNSEERIRLSGANAAINSEEQIRLSGANSRINSEERIRLSGANAAINSVEQIRLSGANSRINSEERIRLSGANAAINSVEQIRLSGRINSEERNRFSGESDRIQIRLSGANCRMKTSQEKSWLNCDFWEKRQPQKENMLNTEVGSVEFSNNDIETSSKTSSRVGKKERSIILNNRWHENEFSISQWSGSPEETVDRLPFNIDGWCKYNIKCELQDIMTCSKDGRPWRKWVTSSRKGFPGIRRVTRCQGSLACISKFCLYRREYGYPNRHHFVKCSGSSVCFTCSMPAERARCPAVKVWEYDKRLQVVTIFHDGIHTCTAKNNVKRPTRQAILKAIRSNPTVAPSKLVSSEMVKRMSSEDFNWADVEQVAEHFVDVKRVQNVKNELKRQMNPIGENFEAIALFRKKCAEKDGCLIYSVNNRDLNGSPSYVFKASLGMARLAFEMGRDGGGVLCNEFAHVDATHTRCRGFKSVTLWTYHPVMRKLLRLVVMDVEKEDSENLQKFWELLNEMLFSLFGKKFNPAGFVADEHHANWISINKVFGSDVLQRVVSCEFHFKQSLQRHSKRIKGVAADSFIRLGENMLTASSLLEFEAACSELKKFIDDYPMFSDWYSWWYQRRTHIFRAFKPCWAPASNLAEVGHAKLSAIGRLYMSLLEAAREDVAGAIRQDAEIRSFEEGIAKGGRGIDQNKRKAVLYKEQMKRAKAYGEELEEVLSTNGNPLTPLGMPDKFLPVTGRHRPPEKKRNQKQRLLVGGADNSLTVNRHRQNVAKNVVKKAKQHSATAVKEKSVFFHLVLFSSISNLKKCYGCGQIFKAGHKKPPRDLILKHFCHRRYKKKDGVEGVSRTPQAAYFHLQLDCARKVVATMEKTDILIHDEVKEKLTVQHKLHLKRFGIDVE